MKILALDTSGKQAVAAIVNGYITLGEIIVNSKTGENSWTHSETLKPIVDELFKLTRLKPKELDYVAYTNGPGSFTGLRIAVSTALGLAKALNIPAVPVPTLDAFAYNILVSGITEVVMPMLDARRGQVYTGIYNVDGVAIKRITDYLACSIDSSLTTVVETFDSKLLVFGDGALVNEEMINKITPHAIILKTQNHIRGSSIAFCALEKIRNGEDFSKPIDIIYVREPQAVREQKKS